MRSSERLTGPAGNRPVAWWSRFLAGFVVLYGTLAGLAEIDATGRLGLPILAGVLLVAVAVERVLYGTPIGAAAAALGFGKPAARAGRPWPWPCRCRSWCCRRC